VGGYFCSEYVPFIKNVGNINVSELRGKFSSSK